MKIFKIKFDSKMPTTRKVTVGKDDDFGLAIQIDGMQSQGPAKLLYAGQEVEANKDLIEGYNVFLLKAVKDSTISIKDIDSQVTFTVEISIKKTDVVELGGAGGGGDAVWEFDGQCTYSIPGVLSVDSCYGRIKSNGQMTFIPENGQAAVGVLQDTISLSSYIMRVDADQCIDIRTNGAATIASNNDLQIIHGCFDQPVFKAQGCNVTLGDPDKSLDIQGGYVCISAQHICFEAPCDICIKGGQVRIYNYNGNETLNIGSSQWFGNACKSTTIKGQSITICSNNSLNLNADSINMMYSGGQQVFSATPSNQCIAFGNCSRTLELDASDMLLYAPNGHVRLNIRDFSINGYGCDENYYSYCHYGYYCQSVPNINLPYGTITVAGNKNTGMGLRTKTLAIVLSAVECALLPGNHFSKEFDTEATTAFNKLTSIFSA